MLKRFISLFIVFCILMVSVACGKKERGSLSEKIVAVEANSISLQAAQTIKAEVKEIQEFSTLDGAVSSLEAREVDFVVMDEFSASEYIENKRKIKSVKPLSFTTEFCAYFYNNEDLLNNFNRFVLELVEDGTIDEIKEAYKEGKAYYPALTKLSGEVPVLTIAVPIVGAPYSDLTESGAVIGIDIDIATIIANKLGYNLEIMVVGVDEAFDLLEKDEVDFAISGLIYESERMTDFDCSFSYLTVGYYLLERD